MEPLVPAEEIERSIHSLRGRRIMLDADLAALYGVKTKELNKAVKRQRSRFPEDFMFQLNRQEVESLRFQIGTSKKGRGGRRYLPRAFTEEGVAMLSGVLNSPRAVRVNIEIMRAFVNLHCVLSINKEISIRLDEIERRLLVHGARLRRNAKGIGAVFAEIRRLMDPPVPPRKLIGFLAGDES